MSEDFIQRYGMSDSAILVQLGTFIQKTRLSQNKTQQEVADAAGVNRSTLVQIEKGKGINMLSFIQLLRALELLHLLDVFTVKQELSPLKLAEMEMKTRQRARRKSEEDDKPESTW